MRQLEVKQAWLPKKALEKADDALEIEKKTNEKYYLPKGEYTVHFTIGETKTKKTLTVK